MDVPLRPLRPGHKDVGRTGTNSASMMIRSLCSACALITLLPFGPIRATEGPGSRVIVSTTLNSTLQFFDAASLQELQPPLPSKGLGPVRMWVEHVGVDLDTDPMPYLFVANHGALTGSLGIFDLSGDVVLELPASPFPARPGPVGVVAGHVTLPTRTVPMAFVTNTWFALGGCGMPNGSVTGYDLSLLGLLGVATEVGTVELANPIPWGVSLDGAGARAHVSSNCGASITDIDITDDGGSIALAAGAERGAGAGADGTIFDDQTGINFTVNIDASGITAHDTSTGATTTVDLPGARPIDITLGGPWAITSNGGNDTVSLVDRAAVATCLMAMAPTCSPPVHTIATGVADGAPEGVAYDPASERIFVVNKPIGGPSLTVIQVRDPVETSGPIQTIPLTALGQALPQAPALIAFDVVVQQRA